MSVAQLQKFNHLKEQLAEVWDLESIYTTSFHPVIAL